MVRDFLIDIQLWSCTDKYNICPCCGEHRTNCDRWLSNPHTIPITSISMCHVYHQHSKHKNASNDEKYGIEILMPNTKYARISRGRTWNNDIILDIIHVKISAKRLLIIHYLCTWYETISIIKDQLNIKIKLHFKWPTQFPMFWIYCNANFL